MKKPEDGGAAVDLKATVTLSGEALAALLEEVKNARAGASVAEEPAADAAAEPEAAPPATDVPRSTPTAAPVAAAQPASARTIAPSPASRAWYRRFG